MFFSFQLFSFIIASSESNTLTEPVSSRPVCLRLLSPQSPSTFPSWWLEASSSPSSSSALWWPSTAAPACGPSSRPSSPFASPCAAARARPSPWSSPPPPRASAPRRDSPARPPPAPARREAAAPCGGTPSEVRGSSSSTAAWCPPPSPRRPPPPRRPLRLSLPLPLPPIPPHLCQEACNTPPPTPSYSSTSPPCPLRAPGSSCRSSTSSPCSLTPSQRQRDSPTSDRADRADGEGLQGFSEPARTNTLQHSWWCLGGGPGPAQWTHRARQEDEG